MRYRRPKRAYASISDWRHANTISQKDAAKLFGISQSHLSNIESGARMAGRGLSLKISRLTNVPLENLIELQRTA